MTILARGYDALIYGMAWLAGALLGLMFVAIVVDVLLRNLGFQSSAHLFTFTEYALLMVPCFGAPWLVRERGHVFVEIGLNALPARARRRAVVVIGWLCIGVCLILAVSGIAVAARNFALNDIDTRSLDAPRWLLVACIPIGFLFMATEFVRHLWRGADILGSMVGAAPTDGPKTDGAR